MDNAAKDGHEDVVRAFLEGGVGPSRPYMSGDPLFCAISNGNVLMEITLLAHGVRTRQKYFAVLCEAVYSEELLAMVRLLVKKGNCNAKYDCYSEPALSEAARLGKAAILTPKGV